MDETLQLSEVQKKFLLRTIKFLIDDGQLSQGRQLLMRFLGSDTFPDEAYAQVDAWTDEYLGIKEGEEE